METPMTCPNCERLERELLSALAAIEEVRRAGYRLFRQDGTNVLESVDLSLLRDHDAVLTEKVRKPLMELLKTVRPYIDFRNEGTRLIADKIDALAHCKQP